MAVSQDPLDEPPVETCDGADPIRELLALREAPSIYEADAMVGNPSNDAHCSFSEILALISPNSAVDLRRSLIDQFRTIGGIISAPSYQIENFPGIEAQEIKLIDCIARIYKQIISERVPKGCQIDSVYIAASYVHDRLRHCSIEHAMILLLDAQNRLIREFMIGQGTIDEVTIYPREIVRISLIYQAHSVILAHNHPSGDPSPSAQDDLLTKLVTEALSTMRIVLHDHIIVGDLRIYSCLGKTFHDIDRQSNENNNHGG